jgi:ribosome maturation factor RimP
MPDDLAGLTDEVQARVAALGFDLADLKKGGSPRRARLQVRIDRPDSEPGHGITVDDCALVSRALEQWLDGSGLLGSNYILEVSSPGIERPIRWRRHWERFAGRDVTVRLAGRGRCRATIQRVLEDGDAVVLRVAGEREDVTVPLEDARDARLVVDWDAIEMGRRET